MNTATLHETTAITAAVAAVIYGSSVRLASGRFAMLDDGMGFSLVPWKPVLEQRLGQQVSAIVRGSSATWQLRKERAIPT